MGSREEKRGLSRRYIIGEGASHINSIYGSLSALFLFPVNIYYMILSLRDSEVKKTVKVSLYPRASCTQCRQLVCNRQARVVTLCLKEGGHNVYFVMRAMIYPVALRTPLRAQPSSCREDRAHTICYLSALTPPIPGPARVPFGGEQMDREVGDEGLGGGVVWRAGEPWKPTRQRVGELSVASVPHPSQSQVEEPVSCLPLEPLPGPDMKCCWQIFVLCISLMLILWLMAPCLDLKPESAPHEKWMKVVPWCCSCPPFKFRKYGCPSGTLNDSVCHHMAGGNWFDVGYEKTMGHLMGAAEPTTPDAVLSWSVSGQHWASPSRPSQAQPTSHFLAQIPALGPGFVCLLSSQPQPLTSGWRSHPPSSAFLPPGAHTWISTPNLLPPAVFRA